MALKTVSIQTHIRYIVDSAQCHAVSHIPGITYGHRRDPWFGLDWTGLVWIGVGPIRHMDPGRKLES